MSQERSSRPRAPITRLVARGLTKRRELIRKLVVGDIIGERPQAVAPSAAGPEPTPEGSDSAPQDSSSASSGAAAPEPSDSSLGSPPEPSPDPSLAAKDPTGSAE